MRAVPALSASERAAFIAAARGFLGVRWRHQGRSTRGVDCAGLVICAMRAVGRDPVDVEGYGRVPYRAGLEDALAANLGDPLPVESMQVGDVALMRFAGQPSHVGIIGDYRYGGYSLIHAFAQNRQVVEHGLDENWRGSIVGIYR